MSRNPCTLPFFELCFELKKCVSNFRTQTGQSNLRHTVNFVLPLKNLYTHLEFKIDSKKICVTKAIIFNVFWEFTNPKYNLGVCPDITYSKSRFSFREIKTAKRHLSRLTKIKPENKLQNYFSEE